MIVGKAKWGCLGLVVWVLWSVGVGWGWLRLRKDSVQKSIMLLDFAWQKAACWRKYFRMVVDLIAAPIPT